MNIASRASGVDSQSPILKLLETPIYDLIKGRVTGRGNYRYLVAEAVCNDSLREAIETRVSQAAWGYRSRLRLAKTIISECQRQLAGGRTAAALSNVLNQASDKPRGSSWATYLHRTLVGELPDDTLYLLDETTSPIQSRRLHAAAQQAITTQWSLMLKEGVTAAEIREQTPDSGLVGALVNELQSADILWTTYLHADLSRVVFEVVKNTRLWRIEKTDVALELSEHFASGIEVGETTTSLLDAFGDPRVAARLIRRAKLRCRPMHWRACRRSLQLVAGTTGVLFLLWMILLLRMMASTPSLKVNYVANFDERAQRIPVEDRAWPIYRAGLIQLEPWVERREVWDDILAHGAESEHWPKAHSFLDASRNNLDTFTKASNRPKLGFRFFDDANKPWLLKNVPPDTDYEPNLYDFSEPLTNCLLPHAQAMRQISDLMLIALIEASDERDMSRIAELLEAMIRVSGHASETSDFLVSKYVGHAILNMAGQRLTKLIAEHPELLSDDALIRFAHLINAYWQKSHIEYQDEINFIDDFLQRIYTDNGNGNGRISNAGMRLMCSEQVAILVPEDQNEASQLLGYLPRLNENETPGVLEQLHFNLLAPGAASLMAGRREMRSTMMELYNLFLDDFKQPYWSQHPSQFEAAYDDLSKTALLRARYLPALLVMGWYRSGFAARSHCQKAIATSRRNAWLVTIALECYRREHGNWPESLDALVPGLLPELPIDQFDGRSLRYRTRPAERPLLYSVGPDRHDDLGETLYSSLEEWAFNANAESPEIIQGDWKLFPPE